MLRLFVVVAVLMALWLHWRAAYIAAVRSALDALPESEEHLDDLLQDVRDRRLIHQCRAVLADQQAGDQASLDEHRADAMRRAEHLERFAPLRRLITR